MRKLKVKDLLEVIDGLRQSGYDVDNMSLSTGDVYEYDTFWAISVEIEDNRIHLED